MEKKVSDKFYNIAKAKEVITVQKSFGTYGENPDDDWTETLYKKRNGEFFVYGKGGKNSPFGMDRGGERLEGEDFILWLTRNYDNARNWVHSNCPDKKDEIFHEDNETRSMTTLYLTPKAKMNLKRMAKEKGVSVSVMIIQWAESFYN